MAVAQEDEKDLDADTDVAQETEAEEQEADGADADAAPEAESEAEQEASKEQVTPSLTVTSPGSDAQFNKGDAIPIEFDCEGDAEFTAHVSVLDANGTQVLEDASDLKLEENVGHGGFALADEGLVGGKYDVLVWGESNGQATEVQKLSVEVVDTEEEEEAVPAVAVEGDDDGDDATV